MDSGVFSTTRDHGRRNAPRRSSLALSDITPLPLKLGINVVSFQNTTRRYVEQACHLPAQQQCKRRAMNATYAEVRGYQLDSPTDDAHHLPRGSQSKHQASVEWNLTTTKYGEAARGDSGSGPHADISAFSPPANATSGMRQCSKFLILRRPQGQ